MSIEKIKKLRNITSLGMMECKEALLESKGDLDLAIENLYSKGTIKYVKKNAQKLGFVHALLDKKQKSAVIIEFNTQTDFVSKNEQFLIFVKEVAKVCLEKKVENKEDLIKESFNNKTIEQHQSILINQFKENIHISRLKFINVENGILGGYVHNNKIAVVISINKEEKELAHDLAIHATAMKPEYLKVENVEEERIKKEKKIIMEQIKGEKLKKNENILNRILEGRMNKLFQEIVLVKQNFVKDKNKSIESLLKENKCDIIDMFRFEVSKN